jgi:hypothetical protein
VHYLLLLLLLFPKHQIANLGKAIVGHRGMVWPEEKQRLLVGRARAVGVLRSAAAIAAAANLHSALPTAASGHGPPPGATTQGTTTAGRCLTCGVVASAALLQAGDILFR